MTPAPKAARTRSIELTAGGEPAAKIAELLALMLANGASDVHLSSGNTPMLRVDGDIRAVEGWPVLTSAEVKELVWAITPQKNREQWDALKDTDFAHETPAARFRVNVFEDRKGVGSVMRQIPNESMTAEDMGLSKQILELCYLSKGLLLVTGPSG